MIIQGTHFEHLHFFHDPEQSKTTPMYQAETESRGSITRGSNKLFHQFHTLNNQNPNLRNIKQMLRVSDQTYHKSTYGTQKQHSYQIFFLKNNNNEVRHTKI
ncbi:hypothetical protein V8G54_027507 [Vigna mungo]|uniref:Uncharacterized protein n=1 Tax=Vigna mungo TaxID=3915 RepID=A0AAQ3N2L2_VIGMU